MPACAAAAPCQDSLRLPRRALYLAAKAPLTVTAQSDSLVVERPHAARQRFPAARLDRIVCNAGAQWSGEALALCLRWGVTITWLGGDGHALGDCVPRLAEALPLHTALESLVELADWPPRYGNWLRRRRMQVLVRWAVRRKTAGTPVSVAEWTDHKRAWVYNGRIPSALPPTLAGWCHALVVARLAGLGLRPRYPGFDGHVLELAQDLADLMWAQFNLESASSLAAAADTRTAALLFEAGSADRVRSLRQHLGQLHRFAAQALDAWL